MESESGGRGRVEESGGVSGGVSGGSECRGESGE